MNVRMQETSETTQAGLLLLSGKRRKKPVAGAESGAAKAAKSTTRPSDTRSYSSGNQSLISASSKKDHANNNSESRHKWVLCAALCSPDVVQELFSTFSQTRSSKQTSGESAYRPLNNNNNNNSARGSGKKPGGEPEAASRQQAVHHHSKLRKVSDLMMLEQICSVNLLPGTAKAGGKKTTTTPGATGRGNQYPSSDIRVRYWKYLFENLKRSIDEIYQSCENDESIDQCKEVLFILENCINDFRSLIRRIKVIQEFDKADSANKRPTSLAWEVRKSSPIKPAAATHYADLLQSPDLISNSNRIDKIENFLLKQNMNLQNMLYSNMMQGGSAETIKSAAGSSKNPPSQKRAENNNVAYGDETAMKEPGSTLTGFQEFPLYASTTTTSKRADKRQLKGKETRRDEVDDEEDEDEFFAESANGECFGEGLDDGDDEDDDEDDDDEDDESGVHEASKAEKAENGDDEDSQREEKNCREDEEDEEDEFNPIDLYNQETFNDMESINLDEEMMMLNEADFSLSPTSQSRQEPESYLESSKQTPALALKPSRSIKSLNEPAFFSDSAAVKGLYAQSPWSSSYFQQQVPSLPISSINSSMATTTFNSSSLPPSVQQLGSRVPNVDSPEKLFSFLPLSGAGANSLLYGNHAAAAASAMLSNALLSNMLANDAGLNSRFAKAEGLMRENSGFLQKDDERRYETGQAKEYAGQAINLMGKKPAHAMRMSKPAAKKPVGLKNVYATDEDEHEDSNVSEVESVDIHAEDEDEEDEEEDEDDEVSDNSDLESIKHYNQMIKAYEEEENLALRIEKEQEKKLRSVMAQEAKLTKQLSETQKHLQHSQQQLPKPKSMNSFEAMEETDEQELATTSKVSMDSEPSFDRETSLLKSRNRTELYRGQKSKSSNQISGWNRELLAVESAEMEAMRTPARALFLQEKLSFMSRKTSPSERLRIHEEKQARAQEKREQFYQDRSQKLRELTKKIEEVRELKKKLLKAKKASMKAKLQRAEEKRLCYLRLRAKKAAVEEQKAHEIAFINNLVAQNRKHDILEKYERRSEAIKHNLEEERLRKQEEQKAREHAVELRRKELEMQRKSKLMQMIKKKEQKRFKIEQIQMEKEKERIEAARVKEKTREMRLATIEAQNQANAQEAKKKFIQKQEECSKRHESNLEEMRKKAIKMSILRFSTEDQQGDAPTPVPYDKPKYCSACCITINSEIQLRSHLRGARHQQTMNETSQGKNLSKSEIEEYNLGCIVDLPREQEILCDEKRKQASKRLKKLKNKIASRAVEYESPSDKTQPAQQSADSPNKQKLSKLVKDLEKALASNDNKLTSLDRNCGEIGRILQKNASDQNFFRSLGGLGLSVKLLESVFQSQSETTSTNASYNKTITNIISMLSIACKGNNESCLDMILTNKLMVLMDVLNVNSSVMLNEQTQIYDMVNITNTTSGLNSSINSKLQSSHAKSLSPSSVVCSSLVQLLCHLYSSVNGLVEADDMSLLVSIAADSTLKFRTSLIARATDFISLMVYFGLVDMMSAFFNNIRGPLDDDTNQQVTEMLQTFLNFLIAVTKFLGLRKTSDLFSDSHKSDDSTHFLSSLKSTNMANLISLIYGIMHKDASSTSIKHDQSSVSSSSVPSSLSMQTSKKLSSKTLELATLSLRLINQIIVLDLNLIQNLLGEESLSLQLRHIASYLIWSFSQNKSDEILHEMILLIGYFTVLNNDNQIKIELGTPPTIIQQLCNLPFNYFSDKRLISVLYPTLISCCYSNEKNKLVLTSELSSEMLTNFLEERLAELTAAASANSQANESTHTSAVSASSSTTSSSAKPSSVFSYANGHQTTDNKYDLARRFPSRLWRNAIDYFSANNNNAAATTTSANKSF